jgi:cell division transport system permease protein
MVSIHISSALNHIRRSPFQAMAAIMIFAVTFLVSTLLAVTLYSSSQTLNFFERRPQIIAFLKNDAGDEAIGKLKSKLAADDRIENLNYITKEKALEIYKNVTSDNPLLSELVNPSIFPASLEFSPKELSFAEPIIGELKTEPVVDEVKYTVAIGGEQELKDQIERLKTLTHYLRVGGITFVALLVSTSFLVLLLIISMRMTQRRSEIEILNLIGATPGFISTPIFVESMIYVFSGVVTGWLSALILILYATPNIKTFFGQIPVLPRDTSSLFILFSNILAFEVIVGLFLALTGSIIALTRVKRRK